MLDQIKAHLYSSKIKIIRCQLALMNSSSIFDFVGVGVKQSGNRLFQLNNLKRKIVDELFLTS
ncbi:hypothetical protein HO711_07885 [Streptococcus suis]|nr:hypothetical protein [Streptococcus suis]